MDTNTEYKIVEGSKETFETKINKLAKEGFMTFGSLSIVKDNDNFWYAQLMSRYITPKQ
mgnify:CR=1 FL=1